ncbi:hypothetical protein JB92DRAFT_2836262 [Gautieria morchelliformis]|nr:hypothetical protein JB92DRAFT_2836262 [Gautieria morchelliformis]
MADNKSLSLAVLIERTRVKLKVCPEFRRDLREDMEEWVVVAEELQAELRTTLHVEAIVDPDFECPSDVDDLMREVKEAKEWLGGTGFLLSPEFLDAEMNTVQGPTASRGPSKEPEVIGDAAKEVESSAPVAEPIAASSKSLRLSATGPSVGTKRQPMFLSSEDEGDEAPTPKKPRKERTRRPMPEVVTVEPTPAHCRKGRVNALVVESDKVLQSVVKHGYPEEAYLLGWLIYKGLGVLKRPVKCGRCLCYGHTCSGDAGKMCGRCIHDRQGCVAAEEYVAKDEKDGREPAVKDRGSKGKSKGKGKDKGLAMGLLSPLPEYLQLILRYPRRHPNVYAGRRGEGGGSGGEVGGVDGKCVLKAQRFERRGVRTRGGPSDA